MAKFPALPLFTDAYLGDTTHLTTIEHGAYLLLLMVAWRSKDTSLPDDDKMLARYARMTPGQWSRIKPTIEEFFEVRGGNWTQKRLTDEASYVNGKRDAQAAAGRASAAKRKGRHDPEAERDQKKNVEAVRWDCNTDIDDMNAKLLENLELGSTEREVSVNEASTPTPTPLKKEEAPPYPQKYQPQNTPMNPKVREVMDAAGFIALPPDLKLIGDWEGIGADFQRDILPILRRVSSEYRGRTGRGLVNLGFFNLEVRRKVADDAAKAQAQARSMAKMRRIEADQNREAAK
jgi:uncharacterized protein YdaU (DUF1376 family)